jgi:glutathione S-transferase
MTGKGSADPAELRRGRERVERYATVLDAHLADRRWIAGIGLTLADLAVAASLSAAAPADVPLTEYRNLRAWFAGVQALDCWKQTAFDFRGSAVAA